MFTVSMALGSKELAKRGLLVTRLSAAEDAATMDVLCVDKTGTITMNQLARSRWRTRQKPTYCSLALLRPKRPTRTRSIWHSLQQRKRITYWTAFQPSNPSPSPHLMPKTDGRIEQKGQRLRVMKGAVRRRCEASPWNDRRAKAASMNLDTTITRFLLLLGLGFFFGLAFEEFHARAKQARPGGVRSFPLLALVGALLYRLDPSHLLPVSVGLLVLGIWLACYYWRHVEETDAEGLPNVGLMVPVCNVLAYLLGPWRLPSRPGSRSEPR